MTGFVFSGNNSPTSKKSLLFLVIIFFCKNCFKYWSSDGLVGPVAFEGTLQARRRYVLNGRT